MSEPNYIFDLLQQLLPPSTSESWPLSHRHLLGSMQAVQFIGALYLLRTDGTYFYHFISFHQSNINISPVLLIQHNCVAWYKQLFIVNFFVIACPLSTI